MVEKEHRVKAAKLEEEETERRQNARKRIFHHHKSRHFKNGGQTAMSLASEVVPSSFATSVTSEAAASRKYRWMDKLQQKAYEQPDGESVR